jgi:hypothetical protein
MICKSCEERRKALALAAKKAAKAVKSIMVRKGKK